MKKFTIIILISLFVAGALVYVIRSKEPINSSFANNDILNKKDSTSIQEKTDITITNTSIDDDYLEGSYPRISGSSTIAVVARDFVEKTLIEVKKRAGQEVPQLRKERPESFADMRYQLEIQAQIYQSEQYQSIVLSLYQYSGGANGTGSFKTYTQNNEGSLVTLGDLVPSSDHEAFVHQVQSALYDSFEKINLFSDVVETMSFEDINDFAVDGDNLNIYFDEYAVGPGVLGPVHIVLQKYIVQN